MSKLNFHYYIGQTFDLDQKTMNKMIEDVAVLKTQNEQLRESLRALINAPFGRQFKAAVEKAKKLIGDGE